MHLPISFEFFPAKTEAGLTSLLREVDKLKQLNPEYMSVTYGASGTTKDGSLSTILAIKQKNIIACPHISCIGTSKNSVKAELNHYQQLGINQLVALRGDLAYSENTQGEFNHANELVTFIRKEFGDYFTIRVAAYPETHPESANFYDDFENFCQKVNVGANEAITQYFFNADAYIQFLDHCQKHQVTIPVVPGIMPITNYQQLANFSKMCGAEIPRWLSTRLEKFGGDLGGLKEFGVEVVSDLCLKLINSGAPALHFYSMNKASACSQIIDNLR